MIALILLAIWATHSDQSGRNLGALSIEDVLDGQQTRAGDVAQISGHPELQRIRRVSTDSGEWSFSGRIYDGTDMDGCGCDDRLLRQFAGQQAAPARLDDARVLAVGQPRYQDHTSGATLLPLLFFASVAGVLWLLVPVIVIRTRRSDLFQPPM